MRDDLDRRLAGERVLVSGGAGVIAGQLLARLSALGAQVLSIDRLPLASPVPAGVGHLIADLADADLDPVRRFRPRHVFHLAATFERSVESAEFWEQNWTDNVVVTHRLTELAGDLDGIETFVFASSYLVYDPTLYWSPAAPSGAVIVPEDARLRPRNLCGAAKLYGEAEVRFVHEVGAAGYRPVLARIFRVYGRGSRDVVSRWIRAALRGEAIDVYHPENRFDYVFSGDVAEALLRMAVTPGASGAINVASGEARSIADVIAAIEEATHTRLAVRPRTVDEPFEASCADLDLLRAILGWAPPTSLGAGVERVVEFERERLRGGWPIGAER